MNDSSTAILQKGFRPFFLLAALFSAAFIPVWLLVLAGDLEAQSYWSATLWHGHEMVYGFTVAVIAGFLLTAVGNWTSQETATGSGLAALAGLWLVGRFTIMGAHLLPAAVVAVADLAFLPALAFALGRALLGAKNRRNYTFLVILSVLWLSNLAMHLDSMGVVSDWASPALLLSVDLIIVIALIIGGRIIPAFTRNAVGADDIRSHTWLEWSVFSTVLSSIGLWRAFPGSSAVGGLVILAGVLVLARMTHWGFEKTWKSPIL